MSSFWKGLCLEILYEEVNLSCVAPATRQFNRGDLPHNLSIEEDWRIKVLCADRQEKFLRTLIQNTGLCRYVKSLDLTIFHERSCYSNVDLNRLWVLLPMLKNVTEVEISCSSPLFDTFMLTDVELFPRAKSVSFIGDLPRGLVEPMLKYSCGANLRKLKLQNFGTSNDKSMDVLYPDYTDEKFDPVRDWMMALFAPLSKQCSRLSTLQIIDERPTLPFIRFRNLLLAHLKDTVEEFTLGFTSNDNLHLVRDDRSSLRKLLLQTTFPRIRQVTVLGEDWTRFATSSYRGEDL